MGGGSVERGRGTVSCLTLVRSVRILAIMKRLAGGVEQGAGEEGGHSPLTDRSRGTAAGEAAPPLVSPDHLVW